MIRLNHLFVLALLAGCATRPCPPAPERRLPASAAEIALGRAQAFADTAAQRTFGLVHVAAAEIVLETTADARRRAAVALGVEPTAGGLELVRLGRAGYLVYAPGGLGTAGEFRCTYALLDAQFVVSRVLCG